ncbi:MAG: lipoyl(octanoyl) transferase LipB [Burkholderiales bacterium]|nr:lipoyl(octanoyl) transferase LipB [Burkholderiales bacterium]
MSAVWAAASAPVVRRLGLAPYLPTLASMQAFTAARDADTRDEIWLLQHPPTYTYGVAGRAEHLPREDAGIALVKVDRGGQITYHGPGQIVVYTLLDLRRMGIGVKTLVQRLEQAVLDVLTDHGIRGERRAGAPGVYVRGAKLAALGLRIRNGCSYHGLSVNVAMDLAPFDAIDPCGYHGLAVAQVRDLGVAESPERIGERLLHHLLRNLAEATASAQPTSRA